MNRSLKNATKQLIERVGGINEAAMLCRLGKTQLANCYNYDKPNVFLPIDVVMDLEAHVEMPYVTKCLADFKRLGSVDVQRVWMIVAAIEMKALKLWSVLHERMAIPLFTFSLPK